MVEWNPSNASKSPVRSAHTLWYGPPMTAARDRWLDEGLAVLATEGAQGVRIDRLAARLGLSKGSFHHHFSGADGYKANLLAHFERISVDALTQAIAGSEASDNTTPGDAHTILARLTELVQPGGAGLYRPELDVAVRAWSTWDPDVRAVQARIDAARLAALQAVWAPHSASNEEARVAALLPYLLAVGASVVLPPVDADELRRIYALLLPLVP
jgi:AcrR family transcriptional regulator